MTTEETNKIKTLLFEQLELLKQESAESSERLPELSEAMVKIIQQLVFLN